MQQKILASLIITLVCTSTLYAQDKQADSLLIVQLNATIDSLVVLGDTAKVGSLYADDFIFNHGSGKVEGKKSWLASVSKRSFTKRFHDSVTVQIHQHKLAVVRGKLNVVKQSPQKIDSYYLWYIRIYVPTKNRWQLISHTTYFEKHL